MIFNGQNPKGMRPTTVVDIRFGEAPFITEPLGESVWSGKRASANVVWASYLPDQDDLEKAASIG